MSNPYPPPNPAIEAPPSATPTSQPAPSTTATVATSPGGKLPVTGPADLAWFVFAALGLIVVGVAIMAYLARTRRTA